MGQLIISDERGPQARPLSEREAANRHTVIDTYATTFRTGDFEQVRHLFAPGLIEHNVDVPDGNLEGLGRYMRALEGEPPDIEILRLVVDGDVVAVFLRGRPAPDAPADIVMEIFRLEDGLIAEHWEAVHTVPSDTPNPVAGF